MTTTAWDAEAELLRDEGYSEAEVAAIIGARPQPVGKELDEHPLVLATTASLEEALLADATVVVSAEPLRRAPSLRVQFSWSEKRERIAKAMCSLRGESWYRVSERRRDALLQLAEFALQAVAQVEQQEVDLRRGGPRMDELA